MFYLQEPGFENFYPCREHVYKQHKNSNKELLAHNGQLKLFIIDACEPDKYQQGKQVLITNNWLAPGQLDPARYEQFSDSWYGMYHGHVPIESTVARHKFNCFINRMDPIRQSWLYQLIRRGVFDQGLISFNMNISQHLFDGSALPNSKPITVFENQFENYLKIFQAEHDYIKDQVPYKNFDNPLDQVIMQTEFSIVLESYFHSNNTITFSEKIFRCLKLPRPWIMFAMQNAVGYLRKMGFDVLDDLVDHSYDSVDFGIDRQSAMLDQIEILCQHTLTASDIQRCKRAAEHNQLLLSKMCEAFCEDINITCKKAVKKCLEL